MASELVEWIEVELGRRGWSQADLARASGLAPATINNVLNEKRGAGVDFCRAVARAFDLSEASVLARAGLLDELEDDHETDELTHLFSQLSQTDQQELIQIARLKLERHKKDERKRVR